MAMKIRHFRKNVLAGMKLEVLEDIFPGWWLTYPSEK